MYDAIVVGARCAGSPTAMLLARAGHRVLLVDRAGFPSDTLSTHYIHQPGVARLRRWGLLDRVAATGCPPARRLTFDVGPFALSGAPVAAEGADVAYAPRRYLLDQILVEAAAEAGAEVRERFSVSEVLTEAGRVTGIRGRAAGGATVTERARIVIGADGMRSRVARAVGAPAYGARPGRTCAYYTYWSGLPLDGAELYPRDGRMIIAGPTNDGRTIVTVFWPRDEFHRVRADIEGSFLEAAALAPSLAERMRAGRRAERFSGTGDLPFFFRRPHGPGWALVGDAGAHKDPITAQGISDAFRDAELLAEAVDDGLGGRRPLDEALAEYERRRNEAALPLYEFTHELAGLEPPGPEMQALFGALRDDPEGTSRFFGVVAGTVPVAQLFAPEAAAAAAA
ncbi:MAG TPA: NAD(P)/FAD-dependent oxidoreductase [Miltoncostaeaceae bacterium]|nr:NAD(P)/FAD-dependent oxidoreductase [Miltoncostaeaceae bacterium]